MNPLVHVPRASFIHSVVVGLHARCIWLHSAPSILVYSCHLMIMKSQAVDPVTIAPLSTILRG